MKILIIEDNLKLRKNVVTYFKIKKYIIEEANHGEEALLKLSNGKYDCIVLDINMPVLNGVDFLKIIREKGNDVPVLMLTSNSLLEDKIEAYDIGADDYLTKPFELKELELRVNALIRRQSGNTNNSIMLDDIEVDIDKHKIFKNGEEIKILNKEFLIIEFLARNKGKPQKKIDILDKVWGEMEENLNFSSVTLEAHISTIRKKLGKDFIKTIKGVGYVIE